LLILGKTCTDIGIDRAKYWALDSLLGIVQLLMIQHLILKQFKLTNKKTPLEKKFKSTLLTLGWQLKVKLSLVQFPKVQLRGLNPANVRAPNKQKCEQYITCKQLYLLQLKELKNCKH